MRTFTSACLHKLRNQRDLYDCRTMYLIEEVNDISTEKTTQQEYHNLDDLFFNLVSKISKFVTDKNFAEMREAV